MTATWSGSPRTWTAGELTSDALNTEVRDRFDWVKAALLLHGIDSASALGGLVGARYGVKLTATQNIADASDSVINWDAETWDDAGFWAASPNPGRITIPSAGTYVVRAHGLYAANNTNARQLWLTVNGTTDYAKDIRTAAGASTQTTVRCDEELALSAGDYLQVYARQNSGSTLAMDLTCSVRRVAG